MIVVYFETENGSYAEIAGVFMDENTYMECLPGLERIANDARMIITEATELTMEEVIERIKD